MNDIDNQPDLRYGLEAIAEYVGLTVPQAKHQIGQNGWPTFKQGRMVCARRSTLSSYFAALEAKAMEVRHGLGR